MRVGLGLGFRVQGAGFKAMVRVRVRVTVRGTDALPFLWVVVAADVLPHAGLEGWGYDSGCMVQDVGFRVRVRVQGAGLWLR